MKQRSPDRNGHELSKRKAVAGTVSARLDGTLSLHTHLLRSDRYSKTRVNAFPWQLWCSLLAVLVFVGSKVLVHHVVSSRALRYCSDSDMAVRDATLTSFQNHQLRQEFQRPKERQQAQRSTKQRVEMLQRQHDPQAHLRMPQSQRPESHNPIEPTAANQIRPTFYLHVGLPKTGTTFLQCSLCHDVNTSSPILLQDNLVYLGTCPHTDCGIPNQDAHFLHHWPSSFFPRGSTKEPNANPHGPIPHNDSSRVMHSTNDNSLPQLNPTLVERVEAARAAQHDALVIFEGCHVFSHRHIRALAEFLQPNWRVVVLVAYRPLYEWLPSKYNSIYKPDRNRAARLWPNMTDPARPKIVGEPILPFGLYDRGTFSDMVRDIQSYGMHPAEMVRDNYGRYFEHVHVLPLHHLKRGKKEPVNENHTSVSVGLDAKSVDPLLEYLFCRVLSKSASCQAVQSRLLGATMPLNPSVDLDYDLLTVAAYQRGLFQVTNPKDRSTKRERVAAMVRRRQAGELHLSSRDFAQTCLPEDTLQSLEQLSLAVERRLFAANWTEAQEEKHHRGFVEHHDKFCWVDVEAVLQDQGWRNFFASRNLHVVAKE